MSAAWVESMHAQRDAIAAALRRRHRWMDEQQVRGNAQGYQLSGWTVQTYEQVAALADRAVALSTGVAVNTTGSPLVYKVELVLQMAWERVKAIPGMSDLDAARWLAALAAAPDPTAYEALYTLLASDGTRWRALLLKWRKVGPRGPLGYAAGLTPEQCNDLPSAAAEGLRTLAGLRGWRLADFAVYPVADAEGRL